MTLFINQKSLSLRLLFLKIEQRKKKKYLLKLKEVLFRKYNIKKIQFSFFRELIEKNDERISFSKYDYSSAFVSFNDYTGKPNLLAFNEIDIIKYNKEEIKNILLHEIAHAKLNFSKNFENSWDGHSLIWWDIFLKIGGKKDLIGGKGYPHLCYKP